MTKPASSTAMVKYNPIFAAWQKIYQQLACAWCKGVKKGRVWS